MLFYGDSRYIAEMFPKNIPRMFGPHGNVVLTYIYDIPRMFVLTFPKCSVLMLGKNIPRTFLIPSTAMFPECSLQTLWEHFKIMLGKNIPRTFLTHQLECSLNVLGQTLWEHFKIMLVCNVHRTFRGVHKMILPERHL